MFGRQPECHNCRVELMPDNQNAFEAFMNCRNQFVMGPGGPVDIDIQAVDSDLIRRGIDDLEIYERVLTTCRTVLEDMRERQE